LPKARHWQIGLIGGIVSLAAVIYILSVIDLSVLRDTVSTARWVFVIPCMVLLFAGLLARAVRWKALLSDGLPYWRAFHIMNVAYLVNGVLPLRLGEVARVYLATRAETPVPVFKCTGSIIVERLLDLLAVVMMVAVALAAGPVPAELRRAGAFMGVMGLCGFLMLVFLSRRRDLAHHIVTLFTNRISVLRRINLETHVDHFLDGLLPLATLRALISALFWTFIGWSLSIAAGYVLMFTFYEQASVTVTMLYIAAAAFAIAVPAVPGNLGTYEGSILLALNALGYGEPATVAVAFAVTVHLVNLIVHAGTGVIGFIEEGLSIQQLQSGVQNLTEMSNQA